MEAKDQPCLMRYAASGGAFLENLKSVSVGYWITKLFAAVSVNTIRNEFVHAFSDLMRQEVWP